MNDLPHEFAERVAKLLDDPQRALIRDQLAAPIWQAATEAHYEKPDLLHFCIHPYENDKLKYEITVTKVDSTKIRRLTIEDVRKMNPRFVRFGSISFAHFVDVMGSMSTYNYEDSVEDDLNLNPSFAKERIVEAVNLVSRLSSGRLDNITIKSAGFESVKDQLADELIRSNIQAEEICLGGYTESMDALLCSQIGNETLREICLTEAWPDSFKERLETFVFRSGVRSMQVDVSPIFGVEFFERLIRYWRSVVVPDANYYRYVAVPLIHDLKGFCDQWATPMQKSSNYCDRTACRLSEACTCLQYKFDHETDEDVSISVFLEYQPYHCKLLLYKCKQ